MGESSRLSQAATSSPGAVAAESTFPRLESGAHVVETAAVEDREQRLGAGLAARGRERAQSGKSDGRLRERQLRLAAETSVPPQRSNLETPRLLLEQQQADRERLRQRDARQLGRRREGEHHVPAGESTVQAG